MTPTLWGVVPEMVRSAAAQVVNEKVGGERVGTLPAPADGRFVFANLAAGDYVVRLVDSSGQTVAQSRVAQVQPATATQAQFPNDQMAPPPVVPPGNNSKALVILGAAAIAGISTAIVLASNDDPRPASPSR
jgi:CelD/BcsL family acetyltransferase involved in cellulose biosynthesis